MKKNDGFAIPLVIFVILILSVLIVPLLFSSVTDVTHAVSQDNKIQANYLARSAVDDIASYIIENKVAPSITIPATKSFSFGEYTVNKIEASESNTVYYIEATGTDSNASSIVGLTVSEDKPSNLFNNAIYTYDNLNIEGMRVNGDIASLGTIDYSTNGANAFDTSVHGAYPGTTIDLTYTAFPISADYMDPLGDDLVVDPEEILLGDQNFNSISVLANNSVLRINTGSEGNTLTIGVIDFTVGTQADILVEGNGLLKLYIYGDLFSAGDFIVNDGAEIEFMVYQNAIAEFQTPLSLNPTEDPNKIRIYLDKDAVLDLQANGNYNAYIFGPEAYIKMQSNDTVVNGSIIGNILQGNNPSVEANGAVNYVAPDDSWDLYEAAFGKRFYQ